jgi:hypothetical protein
MLAVLVIGGCGFPAAPSSAFAPRYDYNRQTNERSYYYLPRPRSTPRRMAPASSLPRPASPDSLRPDAGPRPIDRPRPTDAFDDSPEEYDRHPSKWKQKLHVKYV